ncbi:MAG: MotA/TolQ/ExbB proton channel family protein [Gelidibacter sp.]|nr:MotA/TolQ/ExbB proton channel family protein [Gelidibacter sp.]
MYLSILSQGGSFFMYPLLLILILEIVLFVLGIIKKENLNKKISLINTVSLFAIVWGFLGQILGLMVAFESIQLVGDISPTVLAGGLRISFIAPIFGIIIFLISRIEIFVLTWFQKETSIKK